MESQPSSPVLGAAGPVCPLAAVPGDADARGCLAGGRCRVGSRQAQEAALCLLSLPTPHPVTCAAASRSPQSSGPAPDPHSCCPHIPGPHGPVGDSQHGAGGGRGLGHRYIRCRRRLALGQRCREGQGLLHSGGLAPTQAPAWQLHLLPHGPGNAGCSADGQLPCPSGAAEAADGWEGSLPGPRSTLRVGSWALSLCSCCGSSAASPQAPVLKPRPSTPL